MESSQVKTPKGHAMNEDVMKTESNSPEIPDGSQPAQPVEAVGEAIRLLSVYKTWIGGYRPDDDDEARLWDKTEATIAALARYRPTGDESVLSSLVAMIDGGQSPDYRALQEHRAMRAARAAISNPTVEQAGEVAEVSYWVAVSDDGIVHSYPADDGNGGEAARREMNDWINDRLNNGGSLVRLVPLYAQPRPVGVPVAVVQAYLDAARPLMYTPSFSNKAPGHAAQAEFRKVADALHQAMADSLGLSAMAPSVAVGQLEKLDRWDVFAECGHNGSGYVEKQVYEDGEFIRYSDLRNIISKAGRDE